MGADENSVKISIIANFYNSAKFIPKLIRSVLSQTFENWEFIAVNDCSPGNDLEILREWKDKPQMRGRMKIVDNPTNLGISKAKQEGIRVACGEYLTFIDGDDWLESNALQAMCDAAERHNADIVIANSYRAYKFGCKSKNQSIADYNRVYDKDSISKELIHAFCGKALLNSYGYWGKLYRKSILKKSEYTTRDVTLYEDVFFNLYAFLAAERIVFIEDCVYNWRWGGISSASNKRKEKSFAAAEALKHFNDFYFEKLGIEDIRNNPSCVKSLRIELVNTMCASFGIMCNENIESQYLNGGIVSLIKEIISLPAYREVLALKGNPYFKDQYIFDAIEKYDVNWLYEYFHGIYRDNSRHRWVRSLVSFLMK